ncbi:unnamed protein product [Caretta caretta]
MSIHISKTPAIGTITSESTTRVTAKAVIGQDSPHPQSTYLPAQLLYRGEFSLHSPLQFLASLLKLFTKPIINGVNAICVLTDIYPHSKGSKNN